MQYIWHQHMYKLNSHKQRCVQFLQQIEMCAKLELKQSFLQLFHTLWVPVFFLGTLEKDVNHVVLYSP